MRSGTTILTTGGLLLLAACTTRTVIVRPEPRREAPPPGPSTAVTLGIPPGHLPRAGECRLWVPGMPPGRQPYRSRPCLGIARNAPAGSWIVYRPTRDRRYVHVRVVDQRRAGIIVLVRIFEVEGGRFVRDTRPEDEPWDDAPDERPREGGRLIDRVPVAPPREAPAPPPPAAPQDKPAEERPAPPQQKPAEERPAPQETKPEERPAPPENKPPEQRPAPQEQRPADRPREGPFGPSPTATLTIPPGHVPEPGECRIWIPGVPPGQQRHRASQDCDAVTRDAPAGSWVVFRPTSDRKLVYVRVVDERRPGVVIRVQVFDVDTRRLVREERP